MTYHQALRLLIERWSLKMKLASMPSRAYDIERNIRRRSDNSQFFSSKTKSQSVIPTCRSKLIVHQDGLCGVEREERGSKLPTTTRNMRETDGSLVLIVLRLNLSSNTIDGVSMYADTCAGVEARRA